MATQPDDETFLRKYGNYKPTPANVPVTTIKPILGGETPEEAAARRAEEGRKSAEDIRKAEAAERERIKFEQEQKAGGGAKPTEAQQKTLTLLTRIAGGAKDIQDTLVIDPEAQQGGFFETLSRDVLGEGMITRNIAGPERRIVTDAQANMLDALLTLGTGAAYNEEQKVANAISYFPQYGDTQREIEIKNQRLNQAIEAARIQSGPLAEKFDEAIKPLFGAPTAPAKAVEPGARGAPAPTVAPIEAGKPFQTDADLAIQRQLQAAWDSGASIDAIVQLNQQLGRGAFAPQDIQRMRDARSKGGPMSFYASPTGQPTATQEALGGFLQTAPGEAIGGYTIGAANALTAGLLDELAPVIGLDSNQVQAAKDYLRAKAPVASLAGEVTGGVAAALPFVSGVRALTAGTRLAPEAAALLGETAYGATYGAGEAPTGERALGALIGGGAAGVGGALANRFLPGGPGTFSGMAPEVPAGAMSEEAVLSQRLRNIQDQLRTGVGSPELEQEALAVARRLREVQTPEYMRPGYVTPQRNIPMAEPTPASTTSEEAVLGQRLRDLQEQMRATGGSPQMEADALAVARRLRELQAPAGQIIAEPPVGAPLPSAGGAIEITAQDIARFTTPEDRAMFNQRQLEYIARSKKFADQKAAQAAQAAPTPMPEPAPMPQVAAPATPTPAPTPEMAAELGTVIREASGTGMKAKGAQTKLAEMAQVNPEAKAAAERLGIEVPADVFSDNPQVRAAVGLTRSLAGSEAEAAWRNTVSAAVDQADNIMRDFDAQFVEGAVSPGSVSQRVKDSLTKTRSDLNAEATAIYKQVDESVPKQTPVQMDNLFRELSAIAGEVGESGMTAQEKRLMGLIQSGEAGAGDITYGRLIREKNLIGKALKREESPYGSLDEATLKRLYAALATDQLDNVGRIGGEELRSQLRGANLIYAKERALGDRIVNAFGRDLEGGIANKMRAAITGAAKGDPGEFARLMKTVPADLRKEVVATALTAASRSARGAEKGGFGFSEFADLYPKLRANPQVYKQIVETLGPKASDTLRDLFEVSKRITDARANVLTTGKANQALVESLNAEGIIARIMDSTTAKRAVGAMAGLGGPITGAVMPDIMQAMSKGNPDAVRAAGKMFISPEFQGLLTEAATQPEVTERAINRAVSSQRFRDFAKTIGLELRQGRNWLRSAVTAGSVGMAQPEPGAPEGAIMVKPQ